jgi:hypothetical protein
MKANIIFSIFLISILSSITLASPYLEGVKRVDISQCNTIGNVCPAFEFIGSKLSMPVCIHNGQNPGLPLIGGDEGRYKVLKPSEAIAERKMLVMNGCYEYTWQSGEKTYDCKKAAEKEVFKITHKCAECQKCVVDKPYKAPDGSLYTSIDCK